MPLVFEVVFSTAVISWINSKGVGWGAVGGKHSNKNGSTVPSDGDPDWHNSQGRPGLPLESVWQPM